VPQALEVLPAAGREVDHHRVRHAVQRDALDDAGQAEAVIAVEMGDADPGDRGDREAGISICRWVPSPGSNRITSSSQRSR